MLADRFPCETLSHVLVPRSAMRPYPAIDDRNAWESLPASVRQRLVTVGGEALASNWPAIPATLFLEYRRLGNRAVYEAASFPRRTILGNLVLAECVENEGRFLDAILNGIWSICEESFWGVSAHLSAQKAGFGLPDTDEPTVDLFAAETAALVSWTVYLVGERLDDLSPLARPRILREVERRMLTPCLERNDFWWMGLGARRSLNNWTPWICSNWLVTALLLEPDEPRRVAAVHKAMGCVDRFLEGQPADGGCDEGPGYWHRAGASVFDCLDILDWGTDGAIDLFSESLVRNLGAYIYKAHIDGTWFVNFADGSARMTPGMEMIFRFGRRVRDERMAQLARYAVSTIGEAPVRRTSMSRRLPGLFDCAELGDVPACAPHVRDAWLPDTQIMVARCAEGVSDGFFVAAKGGHNAESHNHNDIGHVIVFRDGKPVIVDAGVDTYTAKTFSSKRYELWTMQSAYHTLPTVNGVQQAAGRAFEARDLAYEADDDHAEFALDLAGAYPPEAGVSSWQRSIRLARGRCVEIADAYRLEHADSVQWSFLTPCEVREVAEGLALSGEEGVRVLLSFDTASLEYECETIDLGEGRLSAVWGDHLHRIVFSMRIPRPEGAATFRVLPPC